MYKAELLELNYRLTDIKIGSRRDKSSIRSSSGISKLSLFARYQAKPWGKVLEPSTQTRQSELNLLWAREKISQLTRDKLLASKRTNISAAEQDECKSRITQTALTHHLVSQCISLVAVYVTPTLSTETQSKNLNVAKILSKSSLNQLIQSQVRLP